MRAGSLRHMLTLQRLVDGQDAAGQPLLTWLPVAEHVWADIRYLNGIETLKAGAPVSVANCSIRIRKRDGVEASMRAVEGATIYDIRSVLPDPSGKRFLDLVCVTGVNEG